MPSKPKVDPKVIEKRARAEEREFYRKRLEESYIQDLRDDTISIILGDHTAAERERIFQSIENRGGATVRTLETWFDKKVVNPQGPTLRRTLRAAGHDLGIVKGVYKRRA